METEYDYIVIGAGINGSWSAYHLIKQGFKTLVLEQFPLPHSRGSSHGQSRGIRRAYPQQYLTAMMDDAYNQWEKLENDTQTKLIKTTGLLTMGDDSNPYVDDVIASFQSTPNSVYEVLSPGQLKQRYPCLNMGDDVKGVIDPAAGVIMADKALAVLWSELKKYGCSLVDNHLVSEIIPGSDSVKIISKKPGGEPVTFTSKGLILCAGPWTNKLTKPLRWELPLHPIRLPVFYYRAFDYIQHTFVYEDFWGLPELEYQGLVKICRHTGKEVDPDQRDVLDSVEDRKILKDFISKCFPGVEATPSIEESCIYTLSPDEIHIMDSHPKFENIVVGCGFSGTGFKKAPVTGEILANMVTGRPQKFDLTPFRANRFD